MGYNNLGEIVSFENDNLWIVMVGKDELYAEKMIYCSYKC